jgi:hypothetical protein
MKPLLYSGNPNLSFELIASARSNSGARYFFLALFVSMLFGLSLRAQTLYEQNFNSPSGPNGDIYFNVASIYNGITDGTGTGASFAGNTLLNGEIVTSASGIASAQGGSGYFLFNNTAAGTYTSGMEIWGNQTPISVAANSSYTFSFYLANDNTINNAVIQPIIDGVALSSGVTPTGVGAWEKFSFTWNSGSNTTASLELADLQANPVGNDFGVDTITLAPLPELPVCTLLAVGLGAIGVIHIARRTRTA